MAPAWAFPDLMRFFGSAQNDIRIGVPFTYVCYHPASRGRTDAGGVQKGYAPRESEGVPQIISSPSEGGGRQLLRKKLNATLARPRDKKGGEEND